MRLAALVVACLALAGCGGDGAGGIESDEPAERVGRAPSV